MRVWRLCRELHAQLDGIGAMRQGGRWNSPGQFMVSTSSHLSLAVLEVLVNLEVDYEDLPDDFVSIEIDVPDDLPFDRVAATVDIFMLKDTRIFGDHWLKQGKTASVRVPSVVVPQEDNVCLNPKHNDFTRIRTIGVAPFRFDSRLFELRG